MKRGWITLIAAMMLASGPDLPAFAAAPAPAPALGLREGQIIPASGPGNGWNERISSFYDEPSKEPPRDPAKMETIIDSKCCVGVYEKGANLLVLKTVIASRAADSRPLTHRIERIMTLTRRPGEELAYCSIVWLTPVASLWNEKTSLVRSVVIDNGQLAIFTFVDNGRNCHLGGD